jgi:6-phosphogluconolactonase
VELRVADDAAGAACLAAAFVARRLREAVRRRGVASIAVSGGSTPAAMFDALVAEDVPWAAVTVVQVDERIAPDGDPARNAAQLRAHLVDPLARRERRSGPTVHWMPVTVRDLRGGARRYAAVLDALAPLDVVHLGLGDDGHTASWPPGDPVVDSTRSVELCGVFNGFARMTLTPGPVNAARCRMVLATGSSKAPVVQRFAARDPALPIDRVRRRGTVLVLDRAAAPSSRRSG